LSYPDRRQANNSENRTSPKVAQVKECSTILEIVIDFVTAIVIEIGMEQTRLFQCTLSIMLNNRQSPSIVEQRRSMPISVTISVTNSVMILSVRLTSKSNE